MKGKNTDTRKAMIKHRRHNEDNQENFKNLSYPLWKLCPEIPSIVSRNMDRL